MFSKKRLLLFVVVSLAFSFMAICYADPNSSIVHLQLSDHTRIIATDGLADNNQLAESYLEQIMPSNRHRILRARARRGDRLSGTPRNLYTLLLKDITDIAGGVRSRSEMTYNAEDVYEQTSYTATDLGVPCILDEDGEFTPDAIDAIEAAVVFDSNAVVQALLTDCPYEMYWYDKTEGFAVEYPYQISTDGETVTISGDIVISLHVSLDYALNGEDFQCDPTYGQSAQAAADNARSIVNRYADITDEEKLTRYANEICTLTSYNTVAAEGGISYGNPWQLIWVFDGNPETNVVCEGYTKAFQYLCDLSTFTGDISVITVSGTTTGGTGAGTHMWNVVHLDDGNNYLVDVTNVDEGSAGYPDQLLLAACHSGDMLHGYTFETGNGVIRYIYDADTVEQYAREEITLCADENILDGVMVSGSTPCGQMWYLYDDGLLYVWGTGVVEENPWAPYNESIKRIALSEGITGIGGTVILPAQLEIIEENAFQNCLFKSVRIPDGVSEIREMAFAGCGSMTQIYIPGSVHTIADSALSGCNKALIIGVAGSEAETFAFNHGFNFAQLTDMKFPPS